MEREQPPKEHRPSWGWVAVAATFAITFALCEIAGLGDAPVMDELWGPAIGLAELADGDTGFPTVHPPLSRHLLALPLLGAGTVSPFASDRCRPEWPFDLCYFLYGAARFYPPGSLGEALTPHDALLARSRAVNALLAALAAAAAVALALRLGGTAAAVLCAALLATSPMWISGGTYATIDMPVAAFGATACFAFVVFRESGSRIAFAGFALLAAAAWLSKFSASPLLLGLALVLMTDALRRPAPYETLWRGRVQGPSAVLLAAGAGAALFAAVVATEAAAVPAFDLFESLSLLNRRVSAGHAAYFLGGVYRKGLTAYFPTAFILKNPLGTNALLAIAACAGLWSWRKRRGAGTGLAALIFPAAIFSLFLLTSTVNIGARYMLPIYPLLFVAAAVVVARLLPARFASVVAAVVLAFNLADAVPVFPHNLSFFTRVAGGPAAGHRYLSDSNLDWGQDLRRLKTQLDLLGVDRVALAYFGPAPPEAYGIRYELLYQPFRSANPDDRPGPTPDWLAVSRTLQTGQYVRDFRWLMDETPVAMAGWSIPIYDISRDAPAHRRLAAYLEARGAPKTAAAHLARAQAIEAAQSEGGIE